MNSKTTPAFQAMLDKSEKAFQKREKQWKIWREKYVLEHGNLPIPENLGFHERLTVVSENERKLRAIFDKKIPAEKPETKSPCPLGKTRSLADAFK